MKILLIIVSLCITATLTAQAKPDKIVIVVSSYGKDQGKARPGFDMDEFAQAYQIFKLNGLSIDVASPKGGKVDAGSFNKEKPYNAAVLQDQVAQQLLAHTKPTATLRAKDYSALYIVGGKGPMFDLVVDPSLQDLILDMDSSRSVIAAICHGTIALANIKKNDRYLVENKMLTGFSNEEETMFGKMAGEFPFLLEDKLLARGANYQKLQAMLPHLVKDGHYITGQNPYSATLLAEEIIKTLGKTPVARTKYKDELSMDLVKKVSQGDRTWAEAELKKNHTQYDLELIAVYGYYHAMHAKEDMDKLRKAVGIIELATPYYYNENLFIPLAEHYIKLGDKTKAMETVNMILKKNPESKKANELLKKLKE